MGFFQSACIFICRHLLSCRHAVALLGPPSSWGEPRGKPRANLGFLLPPLSRFLSVCAFDFQAVSELFNGRFGGTFCCCFHVRLSSVSCR